MRLLLTSAGMTNPSIVTTLVELLGKPINECNALCIPTTTHVMAGGPELGWRFVSGNEPRTPMVELGWKSIGLLELTALPSVDRNVWLPALRETDVILANGGDTLYLCHWMRESGFADVLPSLQGTVYVGLSAGSVALTSVIGPDFIHWVPPDGTGELLGLVDLAIFPRLDHPDLPEHSMAHAERWAAAMSVPSYAIDDATAIRVVDGAIDVISEGKWKLFPTS